MDDMLARTLLVAMVAVSSMMGGDDAKTKLTPAEQRVLDQTNEARKAEGLGPLTVNATLLEVARKHSEAMAKQRKAEHTIDGVGPEQRIKNAGYKYQTMAENIHWSRGSIEPADLAMKFWLNSKAHRTNLLNKELMEIGIGVATNDAGEAYFTQVFARPRK
jgi:uncharacterized protein YkwD